MKTKGTQCYYTCILFFFKKLITYFWSIRVLVEKWENTRHYTRTKITPLHWFGSHPPPKKKKSRKYINPALAGQVSKQTKISKHPRLRGM